MKKYYLILIVFAAVVIAMDIQEIQRRNLEIPWNSVYDALLISSSAILFEFCLAFVLAALCCVFWYRKY